MKYIAYTVNADCANITCDEFVNLMIEGFTNAVENHKAEYSSVKANAMAARKELRLNELRRNYEKAKSRWITYAENKWSTLKRRMKYIEDETAKYYTLNEKCYNTAWDDKYDSPSFFDMDLEPGRNGIPSVCVIGNDDLNTEFLKRTYEAVKDNEYFKNAKGWTYVLEISENGWHDAFRPQINLILNDKMQNKFDNAKETLYRAISEFYSGTTYFGD